MSEIHKYAGTLLVDNGNHEEIKVNNLGIEEKKGQVGESITGKTEAEIRPGYILKEQGACYQL